MPMLCQHSAGARDADVDRIWSLSLRMSTSGECLAGWLWTTRLASRGVGVSWPRARGVGVTGVGWLKSSQSWNMAESEQEGRGDG